MCICLHFVLSTREIPSHTDVNCIVRFGLLDGYFIYLKVSTNGLKRDQTIRVTTFPFLAITKCFEILYILYNNLKYSNLLLLIVKPHRFYTNYLTVDEVL